MSEKYILTMDKETALMVDRACEFYSRMVMGQFKEAADQVFEAWPDKFKDDSFIEMKRQAEAYLKTAKNALFPELDSSSYYGVGRNRKCDTTWNVHQVIRHGISWHDHPEGGYTVNFDKPMHYSNAPMPEFAIHEEPSSGTGGELSTEENAE